MTTQDDIYGNLDRLCSIGLQAASEQFTEDLVIEVFLVLGGDAVTWNFGHVFGLIDLLTAIYGRKLIPYLEKRVDEPLSGGGTAYGQMLINDALWRTRIFCNLTFGALQHKGLCVGTERREVTAYFDGCYQERRKQSEA